MKIALIGRDKNTRALAALHLSRAHGFKRFKFDDGVRTLIMKLYSIKHWRRVPYIKQMEIYDTLYKLDPNIWIGYLESRWKSINTPPHIVVPDAKYINEALRLKELGFSIVRVSTTQKIKLRVQGTAKDRILIAEHYDKNFDSTLKVDFSVYGDSLKTLQKGLDEVVEQLK